MTKNFTKKEMRRILRVIADNDCAVCQIKIGIGECDGESATQNVDFLLGAWSRIVHNSHNVFRTVFDGVIRELIVEVDGEIAKPYLKLLCVAKGKNRVRKRDAVMRSVHLAFVRATGENSSGGLRVEFDEVRGEKIDEAVSELLLPWIRAKKASPAVEEVLRVFDHDRQLCSRMGLLSRRCVERHMALNV